MKKGIVLLLTVVFMFVFCACTGTEDGNGGLTPADVAGVWVEDLGDGTETLILREDMTYTNTIVVTNPYVEMTTNDTYSLDGNKIIMNYSDYGVTSEYEVTISGTTMTWDNGQSQTVYTKQ